MRVLFLTHRLPYAPDRGDRIRAYHMLRELAAAGVEVNLVSLVHSAEEEARAADLRGLARVTTARVSTLRSLPGAVAALAMGGTLTHALLDAPGLAAAIDAAVAARPPDVVLAYCSGMARFALRPPLDRTPLVLDMVDVDSRKWAALADEVGAPRSWLYRRESTRLERFEAEAVARARVTLVVNERERQDLLRIAPDAAVRVIENGIDAEGFAPPGPPAEEPRVIFCGVLGYEPNEQAAIWLAREVWPLVRRDRPDARIILCGSAPTAAVRCLAVLDRSIEVTGPVADVRPHLWRSAVATAPLRIARGVQNKVLEAAAAGLPAVVTTGVSRGLPPEVVPACRVADDPARFAWEIVDLLRRTPAERRAIAGRADLGRIGWKERLAPTLTLLAEAGGGAEILARAAGAVPAGAPEHPSS